MKEMAPAMAEIRDEQKPKGERPKPEARANNRDAAADAAPGREQADIEAELADTRDKLLRALADQENMRKQMLHDRDEAVRHAAARLAEDLVATLDALNQATASTDAAPDSPVRQFLSGVEAIERNLLATLARHGVTRIDPLGEAFDPHRHDAIYQRPDPDAAEGTIIEVMQPGYMIHNRLVRPARVGVAGGQQS